MSDLPVKIIFFLTNRFNHAIYSPIKDDLISTSLLKPGYVILRAQIIFLTNKKPLTFFPGFGMGENKEEGLMRFRVLLIVVVGLMVCSLVYADVPRLINFQGRLTDSAGKFVADGNYSVTFSIYSVPSGGSALWNETQSVAVAKGLFNVILGTVTPIPNAVFDTYVDTYLGIQVGADPEMTPRQRLTSLGYSYYSLNSDKLDGLHASDFTSPVSDFGRLGVAADLYEGSSTLTNKYVNVAGPDSVVASSGVAFLGRAVGSSGSTMQGMMGYVSDSSSGLGYGVWGEVSSAGTGYQHYGVVGLGWSASNSVSYTSGVIGEGYASGSGDAYGVLGLSSNALSGSVYGGFFLANPGGTGEHYGVLGQSSSSSAAAAYGNYGYASNSSTGDAYGGYFTTSSSGTGDHYGVYGEAYGSTAGTYTYGLYGLASNNTAYSAYGGYFVADSAGTGYHYGIRSYGYGDGSGDDAYGIYGYAKNSSAGWVYGGFFSNSSVGTGAHFGTYTTSYGNAAAVTYGSYTYASNSSDGGVYAGYFNSSSSGTGEHYGIRAVSYGSSDSSTYGISGYGSNSSTGDVYGGFFETSTSGTGYHYGLRVEGNGNSSSPVYGIYGLADNSSSGTTYGVYGYATNSSSGYTRAGYFYAPSTGTGYHEGVVVDAYGSSSSSTYGVDAYASNSSSGNVYAGYFYASSSGTGTKRGIYAYAPIGSGYAGYFSGDMTATGTKSAAVKVNNGEYRLLYAMESPENWFEDFGEGQLVNGRALVQIDPMFAQSVNTSVKYHVFLTPQDEPLTLAVANRTATSFEVRGPAGSNISFSYRIVAKRKGYEDLRMAKMLGPTPEEIQAEQANRLAVSEQENARMMKQERKEMTEQEIQQNRPAPTEETSVQKVRKEQPKKDTGKISTAADSER
jgi:hypothetical protein